MQKLFIYSGPVHSGKTSTIMKQCSVRPGVAGILQPVVNDKRFLYSIGSRELFQLQVSPGEAGESEVEILGDYYFLNIAFERANSILENIVMPDVTHVVLDEAGILELHGKGMYRGISKVISTLPECDTRVLIVIREKMLTPLKEFLDLERFEPVILKSEIDLTAFFTR